MQFKLVNELLGHLIPIFSGFGSWMRAQVNCDKIEEPIMDHEALGNATFIANQSTYTFGNQCASYFCEMILVLFFDKAYEPHIPHWNKFFIHIYEFIRNKVFF